MNPQVLLAYGSPVAAALPRRWAEALAAVAGDIGERCLPAARAAVGANLQQATGVPIAPAVRRAVFRNTARYYLSLMRLAHLSPDRAVGDTCLRGAAAVQATLARGRGALVLGAHLGNWDVAGAAIARRFGSLTAYAEPLRPPRLQHFYDAMRARHGMQVLLIGGRSRAAVEVLRGNGIVGLLVDRAYGARRVGVPFGHAKLDVPTSGIRLALRLGAGIHTCFSLRQADGFVVHVGPDLHDPTWRGDEDECVWRVAAAFAAALQHVVQQHPGQWCLLQPLDGDVEPAGAAAAARAPFETMETG